MAGFGDKPFGLREVKLVPLPSGTALSLDIAQTLAFKEKVKGGQLEGDDKIIDVVSYATSAEWELEKGGISLEAYALMTGRTAVTSGTTPNRVTTMTAAAQQTFPWFKIYGRAVGGAGDNTHCLLYKCKITDDIEGEFKNGEFFVTKCKGIAVDNGSGIFQFVQNETAANLPTA